MAGVRRHEGEKLVNKEEEEVVQEDGEVAELEGRSGRQRKDCSVDDEGSSCCITPSCNIIHHRMSDDAT